MKLKSGAPMRKITDVGPGDYIKVGETWRRIAANSAFGNKTDRQGWIVTTANGVHCRMFDISRYAKAEDFEE